MKNIYVSSSKVLRRLKKYWVNIDCTQRGTNFDLVDYVDRWLEERRARTHLALLGEFGTGKTWFCKYYAASLAKRCIKDPEHYRIPILIPLQGYTRSIKIEQVITDTLINTYHIDLPGGIETFMHLNCTGHLLLIFDGFDEMERRATLDIAVSNLANILRIVADNSKVLLTSRALSLKKGKPYQMSCEILDRKRLSKHSTYYLSVTHKFIMCWANVCLMKNSWMLVGNE